MKIAILGDVHGNLPAFQTAIEHLEQWKPDKVVLTGDIINRGPCSRACLALAEEKISTEHWLPLIGNHEEYVIHQSEPDAPRTGRLFEAFRSTYWTYTQLEQDVSAFENWPLMLELNNSQSGVVRVTHASILGSQSGIFPHMSDQELVDRGGPPPLDVFAAGHTHTAFQRMINGIHYVNVGAVGVPFDGDTRSGLAQLTWHDGNWQVEIIRLVYDRQQAIKNFQTSGYLAEAGPLAWLVLAELIYAQSQLYAWHRDHFDNVIAGKLTMQESVQTQLDSQGKWERIKTYL